MVRHRKRGIKGAGSVYRRKSDGRWVGSFKLEGMDKTKYVYAPADNNTEKVAYELLQKAMQEYREGRIKTTEEDQKLGDYIKNWFENVYRPTIYITSYARYRTHIYHHIIPSLGEISLRALTAQHVQQFIADKGNEGLSASYLRSLNGLLRRALSNAMKWKLITENVCDQVTLPKLPEHENVILTEEQIIKLIEVANTSDMGAFIKLGLMTGMRHGEMLALKWRNVNLETGVLEVLHSVAYADLPGYGFVEGKPKTKSGKRSIVLPQFVLDALKEQKERQKVIREQAGEKWRENDLVFCSKYGGYVWDAVNRRRFQRVLKEAGLPETMRVHDLRHNVATFLANVLKYPPNFVQALLGHSDITTTLGMYVEKVDPEMLRPMMDDMNRLFGDKGDGMRAHNRRHVVMVMANLFKYRPELVQALLKGESDALQKMMGDLSNLFKEDESE